MAIYACRGAREARPRQATSTCLTASSWIRTAGSTSATGRTIASRSSPPTGSSSRCGAICAGRSTFPWTETASCMSAKAAWTGCRPGSASWTGRATWSPGGTRCRPTGAGWTAAATSTWRWQRESVWTSTCVRAERRPHSAVGQHALSEEPDRVHDVLVRRPAGVGVAQAEQEGVGARGLLPALEFPHARLGVAEDQAIGREIFQRERRVGGHGAEIRQPVVPVVAVRRHDVRALHRAGPGPGPGHPRIAHLNDLGLAPGLAGRVLIYVGQLCRAFQTRAGRAHEAVGEPTSSARGRRHAGAEPERRSRCLEGPRCDLHILERVMLASE